jgi:hypothetical protein
MSQGAHQQRPYLWDLGAACDGSPVWRISNDRKNKAAISKVNLEEAHANPIEPILILDI